MDHTWLLYQSVLIHHMEQVSIDCSYSFYTMINTVSKIICEGENLQFIYSFPCGKLDVQVLQG